MDALDLEKKELYTICGKAPDPTGTGQVGVSSTLHLDRTPLGRTMVKAEEGGREVLLEVDIYPTATGLEVLVLCPRCRQQLRIGSERKAIQFDPERGESWIAAAGLEVGIIAKGRLDIEPFQCTWEVNDGHGSKDFGMALCRWTVAIDNNVARRA